MQPIFRIYRKYLPIQTESLEVQNSILAYLMVSELEAELKKTIFYKVFPSLLYPPNGYSLNTIGLSLRRRLSALESNPSFVHVVPYLVCFLQKHHV